MSVRDILLSALPCRGGGIKYAMLIDTLVILHQIPKGPVVQSIISLTSSIEVKMLNVLVRSLIHMYFAEKKCVAANAKATHIFSSKKLAYMPYLMIKDLMIC